VRRTLRNCRYSMVVEKVTVFLLSLCSWTARSCARDKDAFDRAVKVRVAINCAVGSLRARLEERRSQGAKDDAPAFLLKMDVAKKAAAVRMPLSLFPDIGGIDPHLRPSFCEWLTRQRLLRGAAFEHGLRKRMHWH
jgi:hypothetical protein